MNSSRDPSGLGIPRTGSLRLLLPFAVLAVAGLLGCSGEMTAPEGPGLSFSPPDGATDVRLDASVVLGFRQPADRDIVERSFHLLSEGSMNDSLCSADSATVGSMNEMMREGGMMDHMIGAHSVGGQFHWNGDGECVFTPTAPMMSGTRYMIHLGLGMEEMMGGTSMPGHGGSTDGAMTLHFTTVDEGSHESHHQAAPE